MSLRIVLICIFSTSAFGCHHAFGAKSINRDGWVIDDGEEMYVTHRISQYPGWADPELTYSDVVLDLQSDGKTIHRRTLGRREQLDMRNLGPFRLSNLEARTDSSRQRIWLVDKDASQVIASHDRLTRATTGLGEQPPAWAQAEGGVVLKRVTRASGT